MKTILLLTLVISNIYASSMDCSMVDGTYNLVRCANKTTFCYGQGTVTYNKANFNQYSLQCFKGEQNKDHKMNCTNISGTRNLIQCQNKEVSCIGPGNVTNKKGKFTPFALNCFKEKND